MKVYDTSALLNLKDELKLDEESYIPLIVLKELENIKSSIHKDDEIKFYARKVGGMLEEWRRKRDVVPQSKISDVLTKGSDALTVNNEGLILVEA